ncbi:MAG: OmpA family protein [Chitinophagaceae bacterium]
MRYLPVYFLLLLCARSSAQNLIVNGGFEDENICTEYQKNCAPEGWLATSLWANYYFDQGPAHDGTHFVGLTAGNLYKPSMRNFIRTTLLCGLRAGAQYRLSFYVRSQNNILDSIGVYFSPDDYLYEKRYFKDIVPQLWAPERINPQKESPFVWQKMEFIYTARGDEAFMSIGNFKRIDYTKISRAEYQNDYYFFIDDVSLIPMDPREVLCASADSLKREIYNDDPRHQLLERRMYYMRKQPPVKITLPRTRLRLQQRQRVDTLIIPDIFFATARYELTTQSFNLLDSFARKLATYTIDSVIIEGHTDSVGKLLYNQQLSENRALSVKNYLVTGVPLAETYFTVRGFAYLRPVATNRTPAGRQQNRRVEIFVYRKESY